MSHVVPASTPERCAQFCEINSGCTRSSWLSNKKRCTLSGPLPAGALNVEGKLSKPNRIFSNRLSACNTEKGLINTQLDQCNAVKTNVNIIQAQLDNCEHRSSLAQRQSEEQLRLCEQQNLAAQQQLTEQLTSCQAQNEKDKQQAALGLSQQKEQHLQQLQKVTEELSECKAQQLQCQRDSTAQLTACNERISNEKKESDAQLAACQKELAPRTPIPAHLTECPTHDSNRIIFNEREAIFACTKALPRPHKELAVGRWANTIAD
ncbi:hypothetical protein DM02DRAFT_663173 [Periconia macrospinosa]|uniref:Uncharacterized protein n=1 Tax=Periconia macrospinosa TaxID=97972 RepID=A0A2V1D2E1_9PLEO|nr:hypothetical protein DM02DRAFT_663173 [Periconia macrospinosa]